MRLFRRKLEPPPLPRDVNLEAFKIASQGPLINAAGDDELAAAAYRADAIAREIEQRREEGRPEHPDHHQMVCEAMAHAWRLVGAGKWTRQHVNELEARTLARLVGR